VVLFAEQFVEIKFWYPIGHFALSTAVVDSIRFKCLGREASHSRYMDLGQLSLGPYDCLLHCMSPQLPLPGIAFAAAIRPHGPSGGVADSLDEAKVALRAATRASG
jgi:hypothetical protein